MRQRVEQVLDRSRSAVQSDSGDLELEEVTANGVVRILLYGDCVVCPSSAIAMRDGVDRNVHQFVPEVVAVEHVS